MSTTSLRVLILSLFFIGGALLGSGIVFIISSLEEKTVSMNPSAFDVRPGERMSYIIRYVRSGDVVHIEFSVSGGNNDIDFSIIGPGGGYIYGPLRVYNSLSYEFKAMESGDYNFIFDNSFSLFTTKRVSINAYVKTRPYSEFKDIGAILLIISGIMLGTGSIIHSVSKTSRSEAVN